MIGFAWIEWVLTGKTPFFQSIGVRLFEGALFSICLTWTLGPQFAKLPVRDYWPVKILKKLSK
jgi:hypothetical protein